MMFLLACAEEFPAPADPGCDPRELAPGEVRARPIHCTDDTIPGGEGRPGDWLIENAQARFVIRGSYAALTRFEVGGTLVDAAAVGGVDLLLEYLPDGDRSAVEAHNGEGWAELVAAGVTWHLDADRPVLEIRGAPGGTVSGLDWVDRNGPTLRSAEAFLGFDGQVVTDGGAAVLTDVSRVAVDPSGLWSEVVSGEVDADGVRVERDGEVVDVLPVVDGRYRGVVPPGVVLRGERAGCRYEGLELEACGFLNVRVRDPAGSGLAATLLNRERRFLVPAEGAVLPVGPDPARFAVWAGPAWSTGEIWFPGGEKAAAVQLQPELDTEGWVLADLAAEVAPDADTLTRPSDALGTSAGDGVGFRVLLADDEVPAWESDTSGVFGVAASRAAGMVWSWPWTPNNKKPAHGAIPATGPGARDLLAASRGGSGVDRNTVVTGDWVRLAAAEADAAPDPDLFWMESLDDLPAFLGLVGSYVDVAPASHRTWVPIIGTPDLPAIEAGLLVGQSSAGNGPRILVEVARALDRDRVQVTVRPDAPGWMPISGVTVYTDIGETPAPVRDGVAVLSLPATVRWVVVTVSGPAAPPWLPEPAWAVTAPLWVDQPG